MRRTLVLVFAASTLTAQFSDFAVTDDGRLYFSTPLATGSEDARSKIYRIAGDGLSLFATGGGDDPFGPSVFFPLTSGDGSITGYALNYPCRSGSCGLAGLPRTFYQLQGVELPTAAFNYLQISRNGRFLLGSTFDARVRLIELPSKQVRELRQFLFSAGTQSVANSGAVLARETRQNSALLYVPLDGEPRPIPGTEDATSSILSPGGDRIVYERTSGDRYELVLTNPEGPAGRVLASVTRGLEDPWPNFRFRYQPSFANDGTLLYLEPGADGGAQPMLLPSSGEPHRLTTVERGVQTAILSGDAQLAWLATYLGKLLRVRTTDGAVDEIVPETPYVAQGARFGFPGSVVRLAGSGVTAQTRFLLGDTALPLSEIGEQGAAVQVPWEYDAAAGSREIIIRGPDSPFLERIPFDLLVRPTITFERADFGGALQAAHQDFHGLASSSDPARPGETVHVFARNLGPVDQPVATGERSPISPPARATTPLACYLFEATPAGLAGTAVGLVVPFAGLSGGSIGIYQIDVTIPAGWRSPRAILECRMDSAGGFYRGDSAPIDIAAGSAAGPP